MYAQLKYKHWQNDGALENIIIILGKLPCRWGLTHGKLIQFKLHILYCFDKSGGWAAPFMSTGKMQIGGEIKFWEILAFPQIA